MSRELQPPLLSVSLVKKLPTVIKDEPPESEIVEIGIDDILDSSESEEEIISDVKDIDIVYHLVCEEPIKSEILESYYCQSVETQVLVKAENSPFIETENITQRNKTEDTSDEIVTKGTGQEVVKVQASNEHSNTLSKLETDEQSVLNFSKDLNSISVRSRKSKNPKKTDIVECYKTDDTTLWEKEKEKIKIIKAPVIPVEAHEYISLAKDRHVCNHCQNAYNALNSLKLHIKQMHREVITMYQCPYCSYKSIWNNIRGHIIQKHKDIKDIQWFRCNLCEKKFKLKYTLTAHMKVHLKHKQIQDGLDLKRYGCNKCHYKTDRSTSLKSHKLIHLKPEEIQYFYCYHCSHKNKHKRGLKIHIFRKHFKNVKQGKRYGCNKCNYRTDESSHLKRHKLVHLKPEEIQYFSCYHCSHKNKHKCGLKRHIFRQHFKNVKQGKRHHCDKCNYKTDRSDRFKNHKLTHLDPEEIQYFYCYYCSHKSKVKYDLKNHIFRQHFKIVKQGKRLHCNKCNYKTYTNKQLKSHKLTHLKPEEIEYFYCYHCSYKAKWKEALKRHISTHFKKEQVNFDCYICNFMTPKRESIIKHIKKHSKIQNI